MRHLGSEHVLHVPQLHLTTAAAQARSTAQPQARAEQGSMVHVCKQRREKQRSAAQASRHGRSRLSAGPHPAVHVLPRAAGRLHLHRPRIRVLLALGGVKALQAAGRGSARARLGDGGAGRPGRQGKPGDCLCRCTQQSRPEAAFQPASSGHSQRGCPSAASS